MEKLKIYHAPDGSISLRWPKDAIPDRETLEKVSKVITDIKKAPAQSGNSEQGMLNHLQEHCTTSAAKRQELMLLLSQLSAEDVEEINQRMRDMIKGRA